MWRGNWICQCLCCHQLNCEESWNCVWCRKGKHSLILWWSSSDLDGVVSIGPGKNLVHPFKVVWFHLILSASLQKLLILDLWLLVTFGYKWNPYLQLPEDYLQSPRWLDPWLCSTDFPSLANWGLMNSLSILNALSCSLFWLNAMIRPWCFFRELFLSLWWLYLCPVFLSLAW